MVLQYGEELYKISEKKLAGCYQTGTSNARFLQTEELLVLEEVSFYQKSMPL